MEPSGEPSTGILAHVIGVRRDTLPPPAVQSSMAPEKCVQYGLVEDSGRDRPTSICGGRTRVSVIYQSTGNVVKIWATAGSAPTDLKRFVIQYTGALYTTRVGHSVHWWVIQ